MSYKWFEKLETKEVKGLQKHNIAIMYFRETVGMPPMMRWFPGRRGAVRKVYIEMVPNLTASTKKIQVRPLGLI